MTRTFDENVTLLGELFGNQEYTGRGPARTSRLDANDEPEADPSNGLPAGFIWIRRDSGRQWSRALIGAGLYGWHRIGNFPVEVGINRGGELEAIKPLVNTETNYTHGAAMATAPAQAQYIQSQQLTPGLVTADAENGYGLGVYVQPFVYANRVIQGRVDLTTSVPTNSGERRLAVIAYDVSDDELVVIDGDVTTLLAPFTLEDVVAIDLEDADRLRLGAVVLSYGMTTVDTSTLILDGRDWLTLTDSGSTGIDAIMTDANFDVMVDANGNVMTGV